MIKGIAKLESSIQIAIRDYIKNLETLNDINDVHNVGGWELKGNLKGLWKFKHKSFKDYRLIGYWKTDKWILLLCIETRNAVYKNKEDIAHKARSGTL
jgi:mRNA-degrading endonuclease RelE of RelBE toxin-antitoxin system